MVVGESSSRIVEAKRSTIDGVVIAENTTYGVPTTEEASSRKQNQSAC